MTFSMDAHYLQIQSVTFFYYATYFAIASQNTCTIKTETDKASLVKDSCTDAQQINWTM